MKILEKQKAFTLIELLVVVAIIGILASIVIINVNNARTKAQVNGIKESMNSLRAGGELYAGASGNYLGFCASDNCVSGSSDWKNVCLSVQRHGGNLICNVSADAWVASSPLPDGTVYCVDSKNNTGNLAPGAGVYA
ncbi:MAG TPA: type II secretion system protein, partial [Thermodesulfobacteriota bacterium]|nr:type II secretion system protein [Thermodesulfobacteriota bacterium]